jgi:hypothetical protein
MTRLFSTIVSLACALWLGGMVMLFVALGTIFTTRGYDRETAGAFASRLFPTFERMQLVFAAIALLATAGWWLRSRTPLKMVLFVLFAVATVLAVVETTMITPKVEAMRIAGERGTPAFDRMHTISSRVYMSSAVILLIASVLLPFAIYGDGRAENVITHGHDSSGNGFGVKHGQPEDELSTRRTRART